MRYRDPPMHTDPCAIFVHAGAGFHSHSNEASHLKACQEAAKIGMSFLRCGHSAVDAVEMAIKALEDNPITNAGYGSNLTIKGDVECDATIVDHYGRSGAAGAVSKVRNPISLARLVMDASSTSMLLSRVPPNLLVGQGATDYAAENGMMIFHSDMLVTEVARARWKKWHADLREAEDREIAREEGGHVSSVRSPSPDEQSNEEASGTRIDNATQQFPRSPESSTTSLSSWSAINSPSRHARPLTQSAADFSAVEAPGAGLEHPGIVWRKADILAGAQDMDTRGRFNASRRASRLSASQSHSPSLKVDGHDRGNSPLATSGVRTSPSRLKRLKLRMGSKEPLGAHGSLVQKVSIPDRLPAQHQISDPMLTYPISDHGGIPEKLEVTSSPEPETPAKRSKFEEVFDGSVDLASGKSILAESLIPSTFEPNPILSSTSDRRLDEFLRSRDDCVLDTVGAIAVDSNGRIAAASSSGGIGMKHKGRAGPAALVGIGTAVIPRDPHDSDQASVAAVTSGTGEHMATTMAAYTAAERIYSCVRKRKGGGLESADEGQALKAMIDVDFMGHPGVVHSPCSGALGVMAVKRTRDGIYLYFGHNTDSFAIASMSSDDKKPRSVMSRNHSQGNSATGARSFRFAAQQASDWDYRQNSGYATMPRASRGMK